MDTTCGRKIACVCVVGCGDCGGCSGCGDCAHEHRRNDPSNVTRRMSGLRSRFAAPCAQRSCKPEASVNNALLALMTPLASLSN
jgi:hypothetical protein